MKFEGWWSEFASGIDADQHHKWFARRAWKAATEEAAKIAATEGPCCYEQKCHDAAAAAIRNQETGQQRDG